RQHVPQDPPHWRDHLLALVVDRDDDRDRRVHTSTPRPVRPHMSTMGRSVTRSAYSACGAAMTRRSASASTRSRGTRRSSRTYGSVHSTDLAFSRRIRRSLYARLWRGSSLPPLNAMPRMPTVELARSNRVSKRDTRYRGRPSLMSIAEWPSTKLFRLNAASCMVSLNRQGPAAKPGMGTSAARG